MSKHVLLSTEISRGRALLSGGGSPRDALMRLRQWELRLPLRGVGRPAPAILRWNKLVSEVITEAAPLGAPVGRLLREVHPMIRKEERLHIRMLGIERQFAFQAAIAVVLPWAVASLSGGVRANIFTWIGFFFQCLGLLTFAVAVKSATRSKNEERSQLFELLVGTWMRCLAGMSLRASLESALQSAPAGRFKSGWVAWCESRSEGGWADEMHASRAAAGLLTPILGSGAPAAETLSDYIIQLDDERQSALDEKIAALPTKLSLGFCAFLTPAVFLILLGALWPDLQGVGF